MITVTGATGQLGGQIVDALLETIPATEVAAAVRTPAKASALTDKGVTVNQADYDDIAALTRAFAGSHTVMLVSGDAPVETRIIQHRNAIDAAKAGGVERVVYTSFLDARPQSPFTFSAIHADTESYLKDSGLGWTILRPSAYAELNLANAERAVAQGRHVAPTGDAAVSYISRHDIARTAAAVLTGDGHLGETYELTGPEAVSQPQIAKLLSVITGMNIEFHNSTLRQFTDGLQAVGLPDFMVVALTGLQEAIIDGAMAPVSKDVETLTGTAAESLDSILRRSLT